MSTAGRFCHPRRPESVLALGRDYNALVVARVRIIVDGAEIAQ